MRIAIIGGGLSAYFLAYRLRGESGYSVDVFEDSSNAGGNAHTCNVDVDARFQRWADLAVNDFNAPMYRQVVDIMDALGVEYAPLEDTASFFTSDGQGYTLDGGYGTAAPEEFEHLYSVFAARAWDVMKGPLAATTYSDMNVATFLKNETPFAGSPEFAARCILPRVNAMYFCADAGPAQMPIQTAYYYYLLQEGFGTDTYASPNGPVSMVNRQYFKKGAHSLVTALRSSALQAGVTIHSSGPATVAPQTGAGPTVLQNGVPVGQYDRVVFTCHADDAKDALPASYDQMVLGGLLGSVNYTKSTAYVHQDDTLLPAPELRRTYNVWIRGAGEATNYAMTYVINQHQADRENAVDRYFDCNEYYVSLNPPKTPAKILVDENTGQPAQYDFFHNVGDLNLVSAQARLWQAGAPALQGINGIYFIGGWTVGAGLMIECWEAVQSLVALWKGETPHAAFDKSRPGALYAPSYIRRLRPPKSGVSLSRGNAKPR